MTVYEELLNAPAMYLDSNALIQAELEGSVVMLILEALSSVPMYTSMLAFGEYTKALSRKTRKHDAAVYMYGIRNLMSRFDRGVLLLVEPVVEKPVVTV